MKNESKVHRTKAPKPQQEVIDNYAEAQGIDTKQIEVGVSMFESLTLLMSVIGLLEVGFTYCSLFILILNVVAFYEMVSLQRLKDKEAMILIKSKITEWYFFFCIQFMMVPRTWLTLDFLQSSDIVLDESSLIFILAYKYHSLTSFMLITFGIILFVISLQDGFYDYQFKMLGWTILSAVLLVWGGHGMLLSLKTCRMWFFYSVCCISIHNAVDHLMQIYFPLKTPLSMLKPDATLEGFLAGVVACFAFFTVTLNYLIDVEWFLRIPTRNTLVPFDQSVYVTAKGPFYEKQIQSVSWMKALNMEPLQFQASEFEIHLFVITIFVAFVAPFGGFLFAGLKRAMRHSQIGITIFRGSVIDRLDCCIITGCFMLVYVSMLLHRYQALDASKILDMVANLSDEAQIELYHLLMADLKLSQTG